MMRATITVFMAILFACAVPGQTPAEAPAKGEFITKAQFLAPEPAPVLAGQPAAIPLTELVGEPATGCCGGTVSASGCAECGNCCGSGGCGRCGQSHYCAACYMSQHQSYFPPLHGYYYFRPYHISHVRQHQMLVQSWGGNRAHPYANEIFEQVYTQYKADSK